MPRLIDLTMKLGEDAPKHPLHPRGPLILPVGTHEVTQHFYAPTWEQERPPVYGGLPEEEVCVPRGGSGWINEYILTCGHHGTHIDAGMHVDGQSDEDAAQIPLEACYGPAVVLDVSDRVGDQDRYAVTVADLEHAERTVGERVRDGDIVLINTGWGRFAEGPQKDPDKYIFGWPGPAVEVAGWMIDRNVKLVGIDSTQLDHNAVISCHANFFYRKRLLGKNNIYIVENLVNLSQIPTPRFTFIGLPVPFVGSSGSPIRAVALISD